MGFTIGFFVYGLPAGLVMGFSVYGLPAGLVMGFLRYALFASPPRPPCYFNVLPQETYHLFSGYYGKSTAENSQ